MPTAVGDGETAVGESVGGEVTGVPVAVGDGEGVTVGVVTGVAVSKLVGVIVGWGRSGGSPSGGKPPSRDWIR